MNKRDKRYKEVHVFWNSQAKKYGTNQDASWADLLVEKEISLISDYLQNGEKVLDVGCANGHSSIEITRKKSIQLTGIDYSSLMIENANDAKKRLPVQIRKRLNFQKGNVLKLSSLQKRFDKVVSIRCFCNLPTWQDQSKAIIQIWKALKPNGIFLLSEPTKQGIESLNRLGALFGLKPISSPWHNLYLDEEKLVKFVEPYFTIKIRRFSSTYYFFSRILYRFLKNDDDQKLRRDSFINRLGVILPEFGNYGIQTLFILTKRR